MIAPIFIFSLPRSGSTLLQRVLMTNKQIASVAEPWILLPYVYSTKEFGSLSEYSHSLGYRGVKEFIQNLPLKEEDYLTELNRFLTNLYQKQCKNDESYFLDKTPRYYLIIDEIVKIFPNAKFIFLFRNPVHVISSIMETWCNSSFRGLHGYDIDLYEGQKKISAGFKNIRDRSYALKYEDFIMNPEKYTREVCEFLDLDFHENMLLDFSIQDTRGSLGDPIGTKLYNKIEVKSLEKWKKTFDSKYRVKKLKKYIASFDDDVFNVQGYDKNLILKELENLKLEKRFSINDFIDYNAWKLLIKFNLNLFFRSEISKWIKGRKMS